MKLRTSLCVSVAFAAIAGPAFAQTAPQAAVADATAAEIIVTGSRVIQNGNDSPTPLTVISPDSLNAVAPGNLAESMNLLPVFAGSRSQNSNTGTSGAAGSPATSTNALNVINLRNMGLARTLILYDGHRAPPSTPEGFVDADTIPQMLIKRVDVVTGGVSAVYGSDGISGVVNFITDTTFNGVKASAQYGISKYGDGGSWEGEVAAGTNLGERLHIEGGYSHRNSDSVASKFDRPWGADLRTLQGSGTAAFPYFQVVGARQSNVTFAGRINNGALADQQFNAAGTALSAFVHGAKTGQGGTIPSGQNYEIGGDGAYYNGQLRASLQMDQAFGRADYDVSDSIKAYASVAYTRNHSIGVGNWVANTALQIQKTNAFLPAAVVTGMGAGTNFNLGKVFTDIPRGELEATSQQSLITAGFNGKLGGDWKWELAYVRGRGSFDVSQNQAYNQGKFFAAVDSVMVGGSAVCRAAQTNAAYAGCVAYNPFGTTASQQAAINYFLTQVAWRTSMKSDDFSGSVSGSPFATWPGPVQVAVSGEYRKLSESISSNALPSQRADCTGIVGNCTSNTVLYNVSVAAMPTTTSKVSEVAGEVLVPLAHDSAFAKSLDLNLAFRHAHYDRVGNANTWKVGLTWQPMDAVTVRASASRDFRAPTLDELYRPESFSLTNFTDRISGADVATNNVATHNAGNSTLKPEISHTITAGIVIQPTSKFSLSVDYFNMKINNAIFLIQGNSTEPQDVCYASKGTSSYCSLIKRGLGIYDPSNPLATSAANAVTDWYQQPLNVAQQSTWGIDFEANYRSELFGRPMMLRLLTTWQPHLIIKQPGIVDNDYAGVAFGTNGIQATPKWRVTGIFNFQPAQGVTVNILERWRSSLRYNSNPTVVQGGPNIRSIGYTNLGVNFDVPNGANKFEFFMNISNLFNTNPPQAGFWGNPNPGQFGEFVLGDDILGRYYTAGVKVKF
jgi:iron complex outermembrane receptor protein